MPAIKLHEQITFLRKQRGITQEALARSLGVTNQAVSKWESGQCCPDIQLLPELAQFFGVSIDSLLGHTPVASADDLLLTIRRHIDDLPSGDDYSDTYRLAAALHTIILSKEMLQGGNPGWDPDDAIEHARNAEWGYSCISAPELTTTMHRGAVFFSGNRNFTLTSTEARHLAATIKPFCDARNLQIAAALFQLTIHDEDAFASAASVAERCCLPEETVRSVLDTSLEPYLLRSDDLSSYRFAGMYLNLLPILSLCDFK